MAKFFECKYEGNDIKIKTKQPNILNIMIFIDRQYIGNIAFAQQININDSYLRNATALTIQGLINTQQGIQTISETFPLKAFVQLRDVTYKPGDILIACDNVNGLPPGYMGHAAIVVDERYIIEVVGSSPIVRKMPINSFTSDHPRHAQFRPKDPNIGKGAAQYAVNYLNNFNYASQNPDAPVPIFNFTLSKELSDEWEYIYCSKLVWLSYYYGAGYEFKNDHLWFAPEDLYSELKDNPQFEVVYIHPEFKFMVNI